MTIVRGIRMVGLVKKRFEKFRCCGDILVDYDEILLYCPDYYKIKIGLENEDIISKEVIDSYFEANYQQSEFYQKLENCWMDKDEIYIFMKQNKDLRWELLKNAYERYVEKSIELCNLIDYIGHYPATYPVPKEEEKDPVMEALLEKYDIMVRYHLSDELDKMQITSDDVVRIMESLEKRLIALSAISIRVSEEDWFLRNSPEIKFRSNMTHLIEEADYFPESNFQKKGRSKRKEGKMYLRKQHGNRVV